MKKIIPVIALILALVLGLVIFSSCAKQAPKEEDVKMKVTFVNKTGETVKKMILKESEGAQNEWVANGKLEDGEESSMEIITRTVNGAPSVKVTYELEDGRFWGSIILTKGDQVITFTLDKDGAPNGEIKTK